MTWKLKPAVAVKPAKSASLTRLTRKLPELQPEDGTPLWRIGDVARRLGVTEKTVRILMRRGLRWTKIGSQTRFKPEWVEAYIERPGQ